MNKEYVGIRIPFLKSDGFDPKEPQVGIFYCVNHTIYYDSINLQNAEKYGYFLIYNENHYNYWDKLVEAVPELARFDEYYFPRGRLMYNINYNEFNCLTDPCIMSDSLLSCLGDCFSLESKTRSIMTDDHYVCHKCEDKRGYTKD